jgi:hypothetical protein
MTLSHLTRRAAMSGIAAGFAAPFAFHAQAGTPPSESIYHARFRANGMEAKPADGVVEAARHRLQTRKNLKAIALGLIAYADQNASNMPPPAIIDKNGKRLLSWRVLILPYVGHKNLYEKFHLDEPWDSVHNKGLLPRVPKIYATPGEGELGGKDREKTYYQALVGKGAAFEEGKQLRFPADFTDGVSNTIGVVEAATAVPWTKPEDVAYDPEKPLPKFGGRLGGDFHTAFMDGAVHLMSKNADEAELRKVITRADGEVMDFDKILSEKVNAACEPTDDELARLRAGLERTWIDVEKVKKDLAALQTKDAKRAWKPNWRVKLALEEDLENALAELDALREEMARLKKK